MLQAASSHRPFSPLGDVLEHPDALDPLISHFAEPKHGQDAEDATFEEPARAGDHRTRARRRLANHRRGCREGQGGPDR
ncbi:hypothetical protein MPL3365_150116 [Mesorhizobium plurifarium]|uniref:Uncharacterized protein n=1 Tax=Mesorhizobium plurifarium TaxID=69974 RepID=A0A090G4U8_MESPL|nr:hypothetical protein MPL3365_150116 [Mesorhizobium plurifarium]